MYKKDLQELFDHHRVYFNVFECDLGDHTDIWCSCGWEKKDSYSSGLEEYQQHLLEVVED